MNDQALARYLQTCCRRLNQQQSALIDGFSLRTSGVIEVQPAVAGMHVDLPGRGRAIANVTPIARYRPSCQEWRWAWQDSAPFSCHHHSATALRGLAQKTGLALFTMPQLRLPLEQALLLLAMSCSRLKASGYYRWRSGEDFIFLAINHMALATAPLEYSSNGDRLQIAPLNRLTSNHSASSQDTTQINPLVHPSPSLLGQVQPNLDWPKQRSVEGFFVHTLCQGQLLGFETALSALKSCHT